MENIGEDLLLFQDIINDNKITTLLAINKIQNMHMNSKLKLIALALKLSNFKLIDEQQALLNCSYEDLNNITKLSSTYQEEQKEIIFSNLDFCKDNIDLGLKCDELINNTNLLYSEMRKLYEPSYDIFENYDSFETYDDFEEQSLDEEEILADTEYYLYVEHTLKRANDLMDKNKNSLFNYSKTMSFNSQLVRENNNKFHKNRQKVYRK